MEDQVNICVGEFGDEQKDKWQSLLGMMDDSNDKYLEDEEIQVSYC